MFGKAKGFCSAVLAAAVAVMSFTACSQRAAETSSSETVVSSQKAIGTTSNSVTVVNAGGMIVNPLGSEGHNGTIRLKVWVSEAVQELLKEQCDRFEENMSEYADIKIEVVSQDEADVASQFINDPSVAADVFAFTSDNLDKLVSAGALHELVGEDKEFVETENSEASVASAMLNEKLYAFPETGDNSYCLVYDKTVVSEEQAKTFEGVLEACKEKNKRFVLDARDSYFSCMFLLTGGVTLDGYEEDGETQKFSPYNMKTASKTIFAFRELLNKYKDIFINAEVTKVVDGFKSGTVGAGIDGSWNFSHTKEVLGEKAGFAVLPTISVDGVDSQIVNMFGYKLIGVNPTTAYMNTSCELAKFLTSEECQLEGVEKLGWVPSNKKAIESELVKSDEALSALLAQQEFSVPQVAVSQLFWEPVAVLGNNVVDFDTPLDDKACEDLIRKTIKNVRNE